MTISKIGGVGSNPTEGTRPFDVRFEEELYEDLHIELFHCLSYEVRIEPDEEVDSNNLATPVYEELKEQIGR